jgi:hypothetical protein
VSKSLFNPFEDNADAVARAEGASPSVSSLVRVGPQTPSIPLDPDLAKAFSEVRGADKLSTMQREMIEGQQRDRNAKAERRAGMSPIQRRRDLVRENIAANRAGAEAHQHVHHIHSVLALCGLPYRRPADDMKEYHREYGNNSLVIYAEHLKDPQTGRMVRPGLPYGPKARLLMFHICTMALRQNSAEVEVADSMSAFIRELGFDVQGGPRGTITQFKEQLHRLAAASMKIGLWDAKGSSTISANPIRSFDIWLPRDPAQKMFWNSTVHLDTEFFASLKQHALPVDIRALRALAYSAKQMDIVTWLGYRLRKVDRPYPISWDALREQFGTEIRSRERKFRQSFAEDLKAIQEVFPKLSVKLGEGGLTLYPADADAVLVAPKSKRRIS